MFQKTKLAAAISAAACSIIASQANAQPTQLEEIVVTGIRGSMQMAMDIKRNSSGVVDAISAEDMGKFPDTNLAESLQRRFADYRAWFRGPVQHGDPEWSSNARR
jgi:outer membrane cobalamin receptor